MATVAIHSSSPAETLFAEEANGNAMDFKNNYFEISPICTGMIDTMLMNPAHGHITSRFINAGNQHVPGLGSHNYYLNPPEQRSYIYPYKFINLIKSRILRHRTPNQQVYDYVYVICYSRINEDVYQEFLKRLFSSNGSQGKALFISPNGATYNVSLESILFGSPRPSQQRAINLIRDHFLNRVNQYNTKVIISGVPGSGKASIGKLLKKSIETQFPGFKQSCFVQLFIDFKPTLPGLDLVREVLSKASKRTPVIIIFKNIDIIYQQVYNNNNNDPHGRISHTHNKTTFHDMLDAIANTNYVISISTTRRTKQELDATTISQEGTTHDYLSFYRPGRSDLFITI